MKGKCCLCKIEGDLQLSHIIPKFVFDWLKRTSPGFIRRGTNPNLRVQDGYKDHILCVNCEQLFSRWEKAFAENIFIPFHEINPRTFKYPYGKWALKFAVSVSWRSLIFMKKMGLSHFSERQINFADNALNEWSNFLLDRQSNPGVFEQHILPLDVIESHTNLNLSPFMNRYILRTVDIDAIRSDSGACVFTKMCKLNLFGFIQPPNPKLWKGTKLHAKRGFIGNKKYMLPNNILDYFNNRANMAGEIFANMSDNQASKINNLILEKKDEVAYSEVFRAMRRDVALSGKKAFEITKKKEP